jgi:chemotaxis protein CheC
MLLTERQNDALTELINIAFARAAASLSEITGNRVRLEAPVVNLLPVQELRTNLARFVPAEAASIHQAFFGPLAGDALLLLNHDGAIQLANLLTHEKILGLRLDESAREALTEVGNILLNACLSIFGMVLEERIRFSVPRLYLESVQDMLLSIGADHWQKEFALIVFTAFHVKENQVKGYLVLVLSVDSLDRLIRDVEQWETRQGNP